MDIFIDDREEPKKPMVDTTWTNEDWANAVISLDPDDFVEAGIKVMNKYSSALKGLADK